MGAEFKQGREIVVERGYATLTGLLPLRSTLTHYGEASQGKRSGTYWAMPWPALQLTVRDLFRKSN